MGFSRLSREVVIASALCGVLASSGEALAAFAEFVDPNPAAGNQFGATVVALSTGNVVITSPFDDAGGVDAGAVYLFNGATGALISTLRGPKTQDNVGSGGVTALTNGNFVVASPNYDNGATNNVGAATWGSGTSGVSGTVSSANSLVGSTLGDMVGSGGVSALPNGNYVVVSPFWDNGANNSSGAVTWGNGTTGSSGVISVANSLVGAFTNDQVGSGGVTVLTNGNYVVLSPLWDSGAIVNAGAATWGSGTTGVSGTISAANSMVGSIANDQVGQNGATALSNGNYVVASQSWDNGATVDAGAATWGSGTTGMNGTVSAANSLVGPLGGDQVGSGGVKALTNGHYVVGSPNWDNGAIGNAGAATWGDGTTGASGTISAANSLVGSTASDNVGALNSVTALTNGNYVVRCQTWDNGAAQNAGAVTWGNGTTGVSGTISAANSLVGTQSFEAIGTVVAALTNGNYVVGSQGSRNGGGLSNVGAATWGNGTTGVTGTITAANSLVGSAATDQVGFGVTALANGNYVVVSPGWDNGATSNVGAATWGNGATGTTGPVSAATSLIGAVGDGVGTSVTALTNGNYVVGSSQCGNTNLFAAGAATWGNGATGITGVVSVANSLMGVHANDNVGIGVQALSNGNYVVVTPNWDNLGLTNVGAATWGSGTSGVSGNITNVNSLLGGIANSAMAATVVENSVTGMFYARFPTEGSGRVRVGPSDPSPVITSGTDIPNDQGGWVRLTVTRSAQDDAGGSPPIATYGVWRHVPGTLAARAGQAQASGALGSERLRSLLAAGLDGWESDGHIYVVGQGPAAIATAFPPGTWELLTYVPAVQQTQYVVAAPTISNAAPNDFVVTANTTTPSVWYISNVLSAQSVDNLAPSQPTGVTAAYSSGQTNLQWAANSEPDLGGYRLYRGASAGFTPSLANRIASPGSTSYADVGAPGSYYKLSAVDVNGNESGFALITPDQTTGVGDGSLVAFALEGARPNPADGGKLGVAFALPSAAPARLELHDVTGRLVLSREVGSMGAGRHTVSLAQGHRVSTGIYWVSLSQGNHQQRARVAVIR